MILISIFTALIAGSIQDALAEDITDILKPVPIKNSEYQFHLQVSLRDADGMLISVTETTNGYYIPHKITDEAFDFHFGTKEIVTVENVKYESVPGVFMGQSSNKKYTPKAATAMNQQWDRVSPEDKNTLKLIQKTNYEYGNNNEQKPLWLDKAEKNKKNTSREARTEHNRGGSSTGVKAKIEKTPIGYVKTIPNKRFDMWNDGIKTDKSPQNIAEVRKLVNDHVKSVGHTKLLTPDEFKYLDKKVEAPSVPSSPFLDTSLELLEARPTVHETPTESFDQFYARREHERKEREFNENIKTGIGPLFKIHKRKFHE